MASVVLWRRFCGVQAPIQVAKSSSIGAKMYGSQSKREYKISVRNDLRCFSARHIIAVIATLVASSVLPGVVEAQVSNFAETSKRLSVNNTFESDLTGWSQGEMIVDRLQRDWVVSFGTNFSGEDNGALGASFVRLLGAGRWEQFFQIPSTSRHHLLNLQAFKRPINESGNDEYPFVCVTYFNSQWEILDTVVIPIDQKDPRKNRGFGDGMNFTSWGLDVPSDTENVHIYIENFANTEVSFDDFGLFDYQFQSKTPISSNLIANMRFSQSKFSRTSDGGIDESSFVRGYGIELWENSIDWSEPFAPIGFGEFGSTNQPEYAYQFVPIEAGKTYTLSVQGNGPHSSLGEPAAATPASFGIDFYDSQWKHIGQVSTSVTNRGGKMSKRVTVPNAAAHSSVFLWCDTLRGADSAFLIFGECLLQKQDDRVSNVTSIIAGDLSFRPGPSGTVVGAGVMVVYSDADGIDSGSIDTNDAYFTSKSNPSKTYPVTVYSHRLDDGDQLAFVEYLASSSAYRDAGSLVIKSKQVKDKKGNFAPKKVIGPLSLGS
jgi:hypothetical protein